LKELILILLKKYYQLSFTARETFITEGAKGRQIRVRETRASVLYNLCDDRGNPDDKLTQTKQEEERKRLAEQLFQLTTNILISLNKYEQSNEEEEKRTFTTHQEKMGWIIKNLIREKVISPFEYVNQEETVDEEDDLVGYTRLPKKKSFEEFEDGTES